MPFVNDFVPVNFINKSVTPTGTPDIDAAFLNYFQGKVDTQGDGLAAYSSDLETLEATVTALGAPFTNPGHISGLTVEWISTTSVRVTSGSCYVPATSRIVSKSTDTTINLTGLSASTWYYLYAIDTAGSLSFEYVTTVPVIYYGTAKQKSGDSSRRYIGSFRTDASSNVIRFQRQAGLIHWIADTSVSPYRIVNGSAATAITTITLGSAGLNIVPALCFRVWAAQLYTGAGSSAKIVMPPSTDVQEISTSRSASSWINLNSSQQFAYRNTTSGGSFFVDLGAYFEEF